MRRSVLAAALVAGCLPRLGGEGWRTEELIVDGQRFAIVHGPGDADTAALVAEALREGLGRVRRFAALRAPVTVTIHASHEGLQGVVGTEDRPWLRAWARWGSIDLQSPHSWSGFADPERVRELVMHELTHCAMYQAAGSEWFWGVKGIPFWFAEGMAIAVAEPDRRRLGPREVAQFYATADEASRLRRAPGASLPGGDPLSRPEPLLTDRSDVAYGAARLAFEFLVDRYGDDRVRELLRRMDDGHRFEGVFGEVVGLEPEAFLSDFRRYLAWGGWERGAAGGASGAP